MRGGIYFHPSNEDLLLGPRLRKMPLGLKLSVKSRIETAVVDRPSCTPLHDFIFTRLAKSLGTIPMFRNHLQWQQGRPMRNQEHHRRRRRSRHKAKQ
jgi:hypothetical protein